LALAKQSLHVIDVKAGCTNTTLRPARTPRSTNSRFAAPIAASAALRAIVDFAKNFGRKSSTAINKWLATTRFAHTRESCWV
jgi:hypothetical protein